METERSVHFLCEPNTLSRAPITLSACHASSPGSCSCTTRTFLSLGLSNTSHYIISMVIEGRWGQRPFVPTAAAAAVPYSILYFFLVFFFFFYNASGVNRRDGKKGLPILSKGTWLTVNKKRERETCAPFFLSLSLSLLPSSCWLV